MIVIDASALAAYVLREEGYSTIRGYLLGGVASIDLVYAETANAIYIAYRRRRINEEQAGKALKALVSMRQTVIDTWDHTRLLEEAYKLSLKHSLTIYDTLYIALAKNISGKLLTRDREQAEAARQEGIGVITV